ncbi:MAG: ATP-binding cassette domain-containing protein, partial [Geminicoccaceae bacterium]
MALLEVRDLSVTFATGGSPVEAVRRVSFELDRGETLAIVGESGSGKSVTALSILQLLPYPLASHPNGSIRFDGRELIGREDRFLRTIRGRRIGMIFQEPMTSLNPLHSVERQITEVLFVHRGLGRAEARTRALELLRLVQIPEPETRLASFPHQLS